MVLFHASFLMNFKSDVANWEKMNHCRVKATGRSEFCSSCFGTEAWPQQSASCATQRLTDKCFVWSVCFGVFGGAWVHVLCGEYLSEVSRVALGGRSVLAHVPLRPCCFCCGWSFRSTQAREERWLLAVTCPGSVSLSTLFWTSYFFYINKVKVSTQKHPRASALKLL